MSVRIRPKIEPPREPRTWEEKAERARNRQLDLLEGIKSVLWMILIELLVIGGLLWALVLR